MYMMRNGYEEINYILGFLKIQNTIITSYVQFYVWIFIDIDVKKGTFRVPGDWVFSKNMRPPKLQETLALANKIEVNNLGLI